MQHKDVTPSLLGNFKHPRPTKRLVLDCASLFTHHVQHSLVAGTIRENALTIDMPTDVFKFLFDGKGVDVGRGYKEYSLVDFDLRGVVRAQGPEW